MTEAIPDYYYYVDPTTIYQPQQPSSLDDLISLYGLASISKQVARSNNDGSKAVKLRKSYKNQISELSGKFTVIPTRENGKGGELAHILFQNNPDMLPSTNHINRDNLSHGEWISQMENRDAALFDTSNIDFNQCTNVLSKFDRSYPAEFQNQGIQPDDLAFDFDGTGKSGKKRKNKSATGSSMATPNSDGQQDEHKRRRIE